MTASPADSALTTTDLVGWGSLPPRARFRSDASSRVLDGTWAFRYSTSVPPDDLDSTSLDMDSWDRIPVPSSWPLHGWGAPAYTNVRFPFPVDPPHVPDENATGDYATRFDWAPAGTTLLRFDGIDSSGSVWLNGQLVGTTRGSRLPHEFDISATVRPGSNLLVVRVSQWSATSYLEDQDMWWLPGLFRSVTVLTRPEGGIRDIRVHADWSPDGGRLSVEVDSDTPAVVRVPELAAVLEPGQVAGIPDAAPWSPEAPRLYDLEVRTESETAHLRIGFRTIDTSTGVLLANGRPVLLRGVNRHEHDPDLGRAVPRERLVQDLRLMKQHNINAIRTSHYPPHPDLLDLADEYGFWVMVECDLETHGFGVVGWRRNPSDDPAWEGAYRDRIARTVERDRNHPSVFMWSLGNESGTGRNLASAAQEARLRDDSRPIHYEGDPDSAYVDVYSRMYPFPAEVRSIGARNEEPTADPGADEHRRRLPFLLCEYAHAMGNGPGGLSEYQAAFEEFDRIAGGFVWEWIEHGIHLRDPAGREYYGYGGDFGETLHDGPFVADGLVDADRRPRPGLLDYKRVIAPVRIEIDDRAVRITNCHDHIDLAPLGFGWQLDHPDGQTESGGLQVPATGPGEAALVDLPRSAGAGVLTVRAVLAASTAWADAGHEVAWGQDGTLPVAEPPAPSQRPRREGDAIHLGPADLDRRSGRLVALDGLAVEGPEVVLWRAPTDNDLRPSMPTPGGISDAASWERFGLDHLQSRVVSVDVGADRVVVSSRVQAPAHDWALDCRVEYTSDGERLEVAIELDPTGEGPDTWARAGVRLRLPTITDAVWRGLGPGQHYPDTGQSQRLGRWSAGVDEMTTDYVVPQESGARAGVVDLELRGDRGRLTLDADGVAVTLSRWRSEDLAAAAHPVDLPAPAEATWLTVDFAQHGIGTASCGPGVLDRYRLQPRRVTGRFALRADASGIR